MRMPLPIQMLPHAKPAKKNNEKNEFKNLASLCEIFVGCVYPVQGVKTDGQTGE